MDINSRISALKGVGEKTEKLLARLEIETVDQLVHHYPRCYTTYPEPIAISDIKTGQRCSVEAEISSPIHLKTVRKLKLCTGLLPMSADSFLYDGLICPICEIH